MVVMLVVAAAGMTIKSSGWGGERRGDGGGHAEANFNISSHAGGGGVCDCHGFEVERE